MIPCLEDSEADLRQKIIRSSMSRCLLGCIFVAFAYANSGKLFPENSPCSHLGTNNFTQAHCDLCAIVQYFSYEVLISAVLQPAKHYSKNPLEYLKTNSSHLFNSTCNITTGLFEAMENLCSFEMKRPCDHGEFCCSCYNGAPCRPEVFYEYFMQNEWLPFVIAIGLFFAVGTAFVLFIAVSRSMERHVSRVIVLKEAERGATTNA
uniref:Niemann-Pick C1 protein n=1 Tax=Steinernema glaseri TaxID=37863 RepID=A0A1I7ZGI1_9BILA